MLYSFTDEVNNSSESEIYSINIIEAINKLENQNFFSLRILFLKPCYFFIDQDIYYVNNFDYFLSNYKNNFYQAIMKYKILNHSFYYYELFSCYKINSVYEIDLNLFFENFEEFILFSNELNITYKSYDIDMNDYIKYTYYYQSDEIITFNIHIIEKQISRIIEIQAPRANIYKYYMYNILNLNKMSYKTVLINQVRDYIYLNKEFFLINFLQLNIDKASICKKNAYISYSYSYKEGYVYYIKYNKIKFQSKLRLYPTSLVY